MPDLGQLIVGRVEHVILIVVILLMPGLLGRRMVRAARGSWGHS